MTTTLSERGSHAESGESQVDREKYLRALAEIGTFALTHYDDRQTGVNQFPYTD